jgi:glutathione synthase/RimK-type ligase-like ATP-grasp enzyme
VPLLSFLAEQRESLVIKPVEGYGGAGVELGWKHTPESWDEVIARAAAGGHVVQQKVPILGQEFAVLDEAFSVQTFTADHNPLLVAGSVAGYYVRLAADGSGMTNVTGGGASVAPTFILR